MLSRNEYKRLAKLSKIDMMCGWTDAEYESDPSLEEREMTISRAKRVIEKENGDYFKTIDGRKEQSKIDAEVIQEMQNEGFKFSALNGNLAEDTKINRELAKAYR